VTADLGSGAGLPGVVLALLRPRMQIVLVEPMGRRVEFLRAVVDDLALSNVAVVPGRLPVVELPARPGMLVARAVAPLPRLLTLAAPLLQRGGTLLAIKGAAAERELQAATSQLAAVSARGDIVRCDLPDGTRGATVIRVIADGRPGRPKRSQRPRRTP
jgi:16S rRNA (guanine527-N7)-methyltransferase